MIYIVSIHAERENEMATSATTSKSNAIAKKTAAVKPKAIRKAAPAPAIKENAAVVKEEAKKLKAVTKTATKATKPDAKVKADVKAKADKAKTAKVKIDKEKPRKAKLVRDSFTMPSDEYAVLGEMKKACLNAGVEVKKSELLRIGVSLLRQLDVAKLKAALGALPALKAGRPKKNAK
jgi:hypothetical protein